MREHRYRPLMAALALAAALAGGLSLAFFGARTESASAYDRYLIEVNEQGFNPRTCRINRGDEIQFKNVGTTTIRVYLPGHGGLPPAPGMDFTLAPGQSSSPVSYTAGATHEWVSDAGATMTVLTPNGSNTWQVACAKEAPTPTPTPTPTATPIAPPTPARPPACKWVGCAVGPNLAAD